MKFTIVIPVYNSSSTIKKVLDSVKSQTFKEYEICIVDDGSTDDSSIIIDSFIVENPQIQIRFIKTKNNGVSKARNLGIRSSESEYIALLDSDDVWHPQKLELLSLLLSDDYSFYGHESTLDEFKPEKLILTDSNLKAYYFRHFLLKNRFVTPSVIFKNNGKTFFDELMNHTEDHDLWLRLSHQKKALFVDIPLVRLDRPVLSEGGASAARWEMRKGELKMYFKATKYSTICKVLFPFLVAFSLLKHLKILVRF